jgi:hypothetical protein
MSAKELCEAGGYEPGEGYPSLWAPINWRAEIRGAVIVLLASAIGRVSGLGDVLIQHLPSWAGAAMVIAWGLAWILFSHVISGPRPGNVVIGVFLILFGASIFIWTV